MQVQEIKERSNGKGVTGFFLIKSTSLKVTQANIKYLDFLLVDRTGEINAKLWECTEEEALLFREHLLVKIKGSTTAWQGRAQIKIDKIRLAEEKDVVDFADYVPVAPEDPEGMMAFLDGTIDAVGNRDIRQILRRIVGDVKEKLLYYPAAKQNHHAVRGGLLYHIKTMLIVGDKLSSVYPLINKDLLFAGIILHDIAKVEEMIAGPAGLITDYSKEGQLLGHIVQGIKWIDQAARETGADPEVSLLLQHMVLSHHYEPEFGSPKQPMIPEGELLHYIDMIDARMFDMEKNLANLAGGEFSDKVWTLNRRLYKAAGGHFEETVPGEKAVPGEEAVAGEKTEAGEEAEVREQKRGQEF